VTIPRVFERLSWHHLLLLLILVVGIAVRTHRFGEVPAGLHQDEVSTAYDAYALLYYGIDRNGFHDPVHFVSWGSGQSPLMTYFTMWFLRFMPLDVYSTRIVNLLFGLLALPLFFLFARRVTDRTTALLALFLLAINPWHIMATRWGWDSNLLPPLFLLGALLVSHAERKQYLWLGAAMLGLCLYAYGTAYVAIPAFALLVGAYFVRTKHVKLPKLVAPTTILFLVAIPAVLYVVVNVFGLGSIDAGLFTVPKLPGPARFTTQSSVFGWGFFLSIFDNLRDLLLLVLRQDDGAIINAMPRYGILYPLAGPFALLGIGIVCARVWKSRSYRPEGVLLAWLLSAVILALTLSSVMIHRMNVLWLPLVLCAAIGAMHFKRMRAVFAAMLVAFGMLFGQFAYDYFVEYPSLTGDTLFVGMDEAFKAAAESTDKPICISDALAHYGLTHVFPLYAERLDPRRFLSTVIYFNPKDEFRRAAFFDRYAFGWRGCATVEEGAIVAHKDERPNLPDAYDVREFGNYVVAIPKP